MTIEEAKKRGLIGYTYKRGSHSQNLNGPDSDEDFGGVYFAPYDDILGLGENYQEEISDEKHDETYWEFGKWMSLIAKGNPSALESLFVPQSMVVGRINPQIMSVIKKRDQFISKEVVKALAGYAFNQIKKARGLGKKIVNPVTERKDVLDFCYTFKGQGSQPMKEFLAENGLDQKYCGLVNIPNMPNTYGVYYDWAAYFKFENKLEEAEEDRFKDWADEDGKGHKIGKYKSKWAHRFSVSDWDKLKERIKNKEFFGYSGIVKPCIYMFPDGVNVAGECVEESNTVRLSSIPKGERPICFMTYNKDAYTCQKRYSKAVEAGYNQKNMCHCIRLLTMAKEISEGKGFNLWRTDDRDFLMGIKNGDYTYEYLIDYAEKLLKEVEENLPKCNLPDHVDKEYVSKLTGVLRKAYYRQH